MTCRFQSWGDALYLSSPFIVSFFLELASPALSNYWEAELIEIAGQFDAPDEVIDWVISISDHVFLLPQMTSTYVLTFASGGIVLIHDFNAWLPVIVLMTITAILAWVLQKKDVFRKPVFTPFSPAAIFGMGLNICFVFLIFYHQVCPNFTLKPPS